MIHSFPPNHEDGKIHMTFSINPTSKKPYTPATYHIRLRSFIQVTQRTVKIKSKTLFQKGNVPPLSLASNFTTHVTKVIVVVHALSRHDKSKDTSQRLQCNKLKFPASNKILKASSSEKHTSSRADSHILIWSGS